MNDEAGNRTALEGRLRSALRSAAESVPPEVPPDLAERIRSGRRGPRPGPHRRWRFAAPILAAAAVAAVVSVIAVLAPIPGHRPNGSAAPSGGEPRYLIINPRGASPLKVRNARTGALVALVKVPEAPLIVPDPHVREHFQIVSVATANGRTYVIGLYRAKPCQSRLYQFTLGHGGRPGPLTPFAPLPALHGAGIVGLAFSANGRHLAFSTISGSPACAYRITARHIGVVDLATGRVRQWSGVTGQVSLTSAGTTLAYYTPTRVMAIPTSAPAGPADRYSRTLFSVARYGREQQIFFAAITPDGRQVVFTISQVPISRAGSGQVRVAAVGSRRSRVLAGHVSYPALATADPPLRHLLLYRWLGTHSELVNLNLRDGHISPGPASLRRYIGELFWGSDHG